MNRHLALTSTMFLFMLSLFSQENECEERTVPYWWNGTNSRVDGEVPTLKKMFKEIHIGETNIKPANGFITLRLYISKTGELCGIRTFQIDENYNTTEFNNGKLVKQLEQIAAKLTNWKRDKDYKTYNLIRFKIKEGKIEEIF